MKPLSFALGLTILLSTLSACSAQAPNTDFRVKCESCGTDRSNFVQIGPRLSNGFSIKDDGGGTDRSNFVE